MKIFAYKYSAYLENLISTNEFSNNGVNKKKLDGLNQKLSQFLLLCGSFMKQDNVKNRIIFLMVPVYCRTFSTRSLVTLLNEPYSIFLHIKTADLL